MPPALNPLHLPSRVDGSIWVSSIAGMYAVALVVESAVIETGSPFEGPKREGTLTLPLNGSPKTWPIVGSLPDILLNKALYKYLLKYDPETLAPRSDLVESQEVSPDVLVWTFHLRKNVTWNDGQPFTARGYTPSDPAPAALPSATPATIFSPEAGDNGGTFRHDARCSWRSDYAAQSQCQRRRHRTHAPKAGT